MKKMFYFCCYFLLLSLSQSVNSQSVLRQWISHEYPVRGGSNPYIEIPYQEQTFAEMQILESGMEFQRGRITMEQHCQNIAQIIGEVTESRQQGQAAFDKCLKKERSRKMQQDERERGLAERSAPYQEAPYSGGAYTGGGESSNTGCMSTCSQAWVGCNRACRMAPRLDAEDIARGSNCTQECNQEKSMCESSCH